MDRFEYKKDFYIDIVIKVIPYCWFWTCVESSSILSNKNQQLESGHPNKTDTGLFSNPVKIPTSSK